MVYLILLVKTIPVKKDARLFAGRHHITCRPIKACISCLMWIKIAIRSWISPKYSAGNIYTLSANESKPADNTYGRTIISKYAFEITIKHVECALYPVGIINQCVDMTNRQVGIANQSVGMTNRQVGTTNQSVGITNHKVGIINQCVGITNQPVGMANQSTGTTNQKVGMANQSVDITHQEAGIINQQVGTITWKI